MEINMQAKKIIILVIIIIVLILLFQNINPIAIHLFFWKIYISLLLILLVTFILGIILGWLLKSNMAKRKLAKKETTP